MSTPYTFYVEFTDFYLNNKHNFHTKYLAQLSENLINAPLDLGSIQCVIS